MISLRNLLGFLIFTLFSAAAPATDISADTQKLIDADAQKIAGWAADPTIVKAVKDQNQQAAAEIVAMTQDKWAAASVMESFVRSFTKNPAAEVLKARRTAVVSEAFLSDAEGRKVAFLAKPTNWNHKGKPKHDVPMSGKRWQGKPELDASTGLEQVQVAVPVLDGGKPIGSLVVGLTLSKLGQ